MAHVWRSLHVLGRGRHGDERGHAGRLVVAWHARRHLAFATLERCRPQLTISFSLIRKSVCVWDTRHVLWSWGQPLIRRHALVSKTRDVAIVVVEEVVYNVEDVLLVVMNGQWFRR